MAPPLCDVIEDAPALSKVLAPGTSPGLDRVPVTVTRVLGGEHRVAMERLLVSLDRDARYARFGLAPSDASMIAHVESALSNAARIIGVFVDHELRGMLEIYAGWASGPAEIALIVEQGWRRRGLGWTLMQGAMRWADETDAGSLRLIFSRNNWPMRQLCMKASARFDLVLDEICADIVRDQRAYPGQR